VSVRHVLVSVVSFKTSQTHTSLPSALFYPTHVLPYTCTPTLTLHLKWGLAETVRGE